MKLILTRDIFTPATTLGKLTLDGFNLCYTLEDTDRKLESGGIKVKGKTAIPRGTYKVVLTYSNRFKRILPLLLNVPQFEGIRIHTGNTSEDTEGCILVGKSAGVGLIRDSRVAFGMVYSILEKATENKEEIEIEIK